MTVRFSPKADSDLEEIHAFHFERNPPYARRLIDELVDLALSLSKFPERGSLQHNSVGLPMRRLVEKNHLIVSAVDGDGVTILRIVHGARDIEALLADIS